MTTQEVLSETGRLMDMVWNWYVGLPRYITIPIGIGTVLIMLWIIINCVPRRYTT